MSNRVVFATNSAKLLVERTCKFMCLEPGKALVARHNDGEVRVELQENVRGKDVFIVGPTNPPSENFDEFILLLEAARRSSAARVTAVPTYMGYNRQDRKDRPRSTIAARMAMKRIEAAGPNRILHLDLHSEVTMIAYEIQTQVDHLYCSYATLPYLAAKVHNRDFVVVSPDAGGVVRARAISRILGQRGIAIFDKERLGPGELDEEVTIVGDIEGKDILFVDDIMDTFGTLDVEARAAKKAGARDIYAYAPHGLFSKNALEKISRSGVKEIITTDTIQHPPGKLESVPNVAITVISICEFLAQALMRIHEDRSLSELIPRPGFLETHRLK